MRDVSIEDNILNIGDIKIAVKYPKRVWRADLSAAAFGKSSSVYGNIDEN